MDRMRKRIVSLIWIWPFWIIRHGKLQKALLRRWKFWEKIMRSWLPADEIWICPECWVQGSAPAGCGNPYERHPCSCRKGRHCMSILWTRSFWNVYCIWEGARDCSWRNDGEWGLLYCARGGRADLMCCAGEKPAAILRILWAFGASGADIGYIGGRIAWESLRSIFRNVSFSCLQETGADVVENEASKAEG